MGVSLGYFSLDQMSEDERSALVARVVKHNESYEWWCEGIWISDEPTENGSSFGSTKLFCLIDDENADTYMAYQDIREIVRFFTEESKTGSGWRLELEDEDFGTIVSGAPDEELKANLEGFLDAFEVDFEELGKPDRKAFLKKWSDR